VPPAGNGTIMVTGRLGHSCAEAALGDSNRADAVKAIIGMLGMSLASLGTDRNQALIVSGVIGA
jgi:hypothetical protein